MPDVKISAGADPVTLVATDKVPMARSASTTAYAATMAELATYANGAYTPNYFTGTPSMDGTGAAGTAAFVSRGDHVHPSDTSRLALAGGTMAGFLTLNANPTANLHAATKQYVDGSAPVGGPYVAIANLHDVGRNLLHNPLFNVAQRGAGPWSGGYTVDRWRLDMGTDTSTVSTTPFSMAGTTGDEAAQTAVVVNVVGNAAAGSYTIFWQAIENAKRLSGKTVTVSFVAYATSGTPKLGVNIRQYMGTGGSPAGGGDIPGQSITLSTTPTRYSLTFTLPSLGGATLGTNNDHYTRVTLWPSCGTTNAVNAGSPGVQSYTLVLWGVQLEVGSVATPLEKPDPRYDLANCQRFYQIGYFNYAGYATAGTSISVSQTLPVTMRAAPTMTPSGGGVVNVTSPTLNAAVGAGYTSNFYIGGTATASAAFVYYGFYAASADL